MKTKGFITILIIAVVAFVVYSVNKSARFAPAEDFPREALVYVQIADLPAFIKLWNDSKFKTKYAASSNFQDFTKHHLGLKLASRWAEFNEASGFPIDLEIVAGLANNQAAMAIYDVGKLDFVFISPISEEVFAATKFVQNQDKFTEETFKDGTKIFRAAVESDRGRQKQELIFTHIKGRFVLATSEKLLTRTLNNINGNQAKNRLIDDPSFKSLSEKIEPHLATIWVNQAILNDNYYFKRYWLMSGVKDLKNIRAGIFDVELQGKSLIERRKFLLDENINSAPVKDSQAEKMLTSMPGNVPFYRLQKATQKNIDNALRNIIFDRAAEASEVSDDSYDPDSSYNFDASSSGDYNTLSEDFEQNIDETADEEKIEKRENEINFSEYLQVANPEAVLTFTKPEVLTAPKFVEFRKAAIFLLSAPNAFDAAAFESAIERSMAAKILVSSPNLQLKWETKTENKVVSRELRLPMLGWGISYAIRGNELILTNNSAFLREITTVKTSSKIPEVKSPFSELTVINLTQKENAYDKVFAELAKKKAANSFFTQNVGSFLDSISEIKKIEIRRSYSQNILDEQLTASFGD